MKCWHGCITDAKYKWFAYSTAGALATTSSLKYRLVYISSAKKRPLNSYKK